MLQNVISARFALWNKSIPNCTRTFPPWKPENGRIRDDQAFKLKLKELLSHKLQLCPESSSTRISDSRDDKTLGGKERTD